MAKVLTVALAAASLLAMTTAHALDLQGHRGARGLAPENTLAGVTTALKIGVSTLELDLGMTKDGVVVVSHDSVLNPDHTRGPDGQFLAVPGPAIRSLTFDELRRYDVGRLRPGTAYARSFPEQQPVDGATIPTLAEVFDLVQRAGAGHVRFNIETKLTPTSGNDTPDPETFAAAVAKEIHAAALASEASGQRGDPKEVRAPLTTRVAVQSFDWRTLMVLRRIAPEIERVCLSVDGGRGDTLARGKPGPSPWTAGLDVDEFGGSVPRLVAAAGCQVWSPYFRNITPDAFKETRSLGLKLIPWTVNERPDMERLIALGVDGIITDYPNRLREVMAAANMPLPPAVPVR